MFCLKSDTDTRWLELALAHIDELLADHAHCEQKAAASALSLINKYPNDAFLVPPMLKLAQEELEHFERVYLTLRARGGQLGFVDQDRYVVELLSLASKQGKEGLIDRLLISSLIEARSAERFFLLAEHLKDEELKSMYQEFAATESRHHTHFVTLALHYASRDEIKTRLSELAAREAEIVERLPVTARMH